MLSGLSVLGGCGARFGWSINFQPEPFSVGRLGRSSEPTCLDILIGVGSEGEPEPAYKQALALISQSSVAVYLKLQHTFTFRLIERWVRLLSVSSVFPVYLYRLF